jgi:hypothetical protein
MADFTKSFRLLLDADTKGAVDGLGHFSDAAKKADTQTQTAGKGISASIGDIVAKTGLGQKAMGTFGLSAGQMGTLVTGGAGVAGVAIAKFAIDSASKFADLGQKVEKFGEVAGTTNDTASRFVAVADDYGVSADSLSTAVGKLGKGLGANAGELDKYGVAIAHAKDGSIDLAQTTFNVIDAYNATTDPAKKAALASTAFGKSYQDLIPLIDVGSAKIKQSFDSVDKAQVFGDKKVAEAKAYGVALDNLKDQFYDFQLTLGKDVIPVLQDTFGQISKLTGAFNNLIDALPGNTGQNVIGWVEDVLNPLKVLFEIPDKLRGVRDAIEELAGGGPAVVTGVTDTLKTGLDNITTATTAAVTSVMHVGDANGDILGNLTALYGDYDVAVGDSAKQQDEWKKHTADALAAAQKGLDDTKYKWDVLTGAVTDDEAWLHLQQQFADTGQAGVDAAQAVTDAQAADATAAKTRGKAHEDASAKAAAAWDVVTQKARDSKLSVDEEKQAVIEYGQKILEIPLSRATQMIAQIDKGNLQLVEDQLETLTRNRTVNLQIIAKGGAGYGPRVGVPGFASGGTVPGPMGAPMLAVVHGGEQITPPRGGSNGGAVIVNQYFVVDPAADRVSVARAIEESRAALKRAGGTLVG